MGEEGKPKARGLTPFGRSLGTAGATLLLLGLAFGSYPYLLCAFFLLGAALWSRGLQAPRVTVERALSKDDVRTGEAVDVTVRVENGGDGAGITLHDRAPEAFARDAGANFGAGFLAAGEAREIRYRLRAPRRGAYPLGPLHVAAYDPLFLQAAVLAEAGEPHTLAVHPRSPPAPRIRTGAAWGRAHLPGGDRATRGILTNDFRELRPYERGDPLRQVNWKATARMSREDLSLIVNDYEVEGKKVLWLFVDASPYTVGGTTLESAFDELASAAQSVGGHYLDMGHRVGMTLYGNGPTRLLYADSGEMQERRIAQHLGTAMPGTEPGEDFAKAVEGTKGFLAREKPLLFVFTLAGRDASLPPGIVSARALASTGRRPAHVVAVTPEVAGDGSVAARLVAVHEKAQLKGLERRGVTVLRYDPKRQPISALLARGVLR